MIRYPTIHIWNTCKTLFQSFSTTPTVGKSCQSHLLLPGCGWAARRSSVACVPPRRLKEPVSGLQGCWEDHWNHFYPMTSLLDDKNNLEKLFGWLKKTVYIAISHDWTQKPCHCMVQCQFWEKETHSQSLGNTRWGKGWEDGRILTSPLRVERVAGTFFVQRIPTITTDEGVIP